MSFLEAVNKYQDSNTGYQLSAEDWASLYPIHDFDVSKHNDRLKNSSADIEIRFNLGSNFRNLANNADQPFYVHAVVFSNRYFKFSLSLRPNEYNCLSIYRVAHKSLYSLKMKQLFLKCLFFFFFFFFFFFLLVCSVVEWLKHRTDDQHGLSSKPTCVILLCPWKRHFMALSPAWWS